MRSTSSVSSVAVSSEVSNVVIGAENSSSVGAEWAVSRVYANEYATPSVSGVGYEGAVV